MYAHHAEDEMREISPGFLVTRDGRVLQQLEGKLQARNVFFADGYPAVSVKLDGVWKTRGVHQIVMMAFGPPRPSPQHVIRHRDGDTKNPHIDNLVWSTHKRAREEEATQGKNTNRKAGRTRPVQVYFTEEELRVVIAAATEERVPMSTFIRNCVLNHVGGRP